jgi:hypothetical protein
MFDDAERGPSVDLVLQFGACQPYAWQGLAYHQGAARRDDHRGFLFPKEEVPVISSCTNVGPAPGRPDAFLT